MTSKWYMMRDGTTKYGPYDDAQLQKFAASGRILPTDMLWKDGMEHWASAASISSLLIAPPPPPVLPPPLPTVQSKGTASGNKFTAGILGILLGFLGTHKFILGLTTPGLIMLLVSVCTCGYGAIPMGIIGLIEGIIYLTRSDEEFHRLYVIEKKAWF